MFSPAIQKTRVLVALAVFNLIVFTIASKMTVSRKAIGYEQKIEASHLMEQAMLALKEFRMGDKGVFVDSNNDPNETALIGPRFSLITTDQGDLDYKLTTLNPNFAAAMVDMLLKARVKRGDRVAVSFTASMPGANIATLASCSVLGLNPVIISSVGASQWGATDPYFTWLDMESVLNQTGIIKFKSTAASVGGKGDTGKGVSVKGRELIRDAIGRNAVTLIDEANLSASINKRLDIYKQVSNLPNYAAFINIGGGAASVGPSINAKLIPSGVSDPQQLSTLGGNSVLRKFANKGVPILHLLNIAKIADKYDLPIAPIPTPEIGEGRLYSVKEYNFWVCLIALLLVAGSVATVGIYSHKQIEKRTETFEPESIL